MGVLDFIQMEERWHELQRFMSPVGNIWGAGSGRGGSDSREADGARWCLCTLSPVRGQKVLLTPSTFSHRCAVSA